MMKSFFLTSLLCVICLGLACQNSSYVYHDDNHNSLELDLYKSPSETAPLMIFVHGGGFIGGTKKHTRYSAFFEQLNLKGIDVVSIDYSKPLLGQKFHCDQPSANKLMAFGYASRDIRRATNWLINNGARIGVSTTDLWLCGSSAGAEALLFALFGPHEPSGDELPSEFSYSGYVSLAGAATSLENITADSAIPGLFIHGSCDALVPLGTAIHHYCPEDRAGALLLYGPETLAERYDSLGKAYQFILHCGAKHTVCVDSMTDDLSQIAKFINSGGQVDEKRVVIGHSEDCYFTGSDACADD